MGILIIQQNIIVVVSVIVAVVVVVMCLCWLYLWVGAEVITSHLFYMKSRATKVCRMLDNFYSSSNSPCPSTQEYTTDIKNRRCSEFIFIPLSSVVAIPTSVSLSYMNACGLSGCLPKFLNSPTVFSSSRSSKL